MYPLSPAAEAHKELADHGSARWVLGAPDAAFWFPPVLHMSSVKWNHVLSRNPLRG